MAETNYSAVDFSQLSATDDGKTVLYKDDQLCQSTSSISEIVNDKIGSKGYATETFVTGAIEDLSGTVSTDYATKEELGNVGNFIITSADKETGEPIIEPSAAQTKSIYLIQDDSVTGKDQYKEWIVTENESEEKEWTCIGDTSVDLEKYITTAVKWGGSKVLKKNNDVIGVIFDTAFDTDFDNTHGNNTIKLIGEDASNGTIGTLSVSHGENNNVKYMFMYHNHPDGQENWYWVPAPNNNGVLQSDNGAITWNNNYYTKDETSAAQEIQDALDEKEDKIFIAEYGVTSYADIKAAYDAGKQIVCKYVENEAQTKYMPLSQFIQPANIFIFVGWTTGGESTYVHFSLSTDGIHTSYQVISDEYYNTSETSGSQQLADAFNAKQDTLTFAGENNTITAINTSAIGGQTLSAGTDLVISDGVISVNTNGSAIGDFSFVEGQSTIASGYYSHAEGAGTKAAEFCSHAEGDSTSAAGFKSHAEGTNTSAVGNVSHAEGAYTSAVGDYSHVGGVSSIAKGSASFAHGYQVSAVGDYSYAEGKLTIAASHYSHVEGLSTSAAGEISHAEGNGTSAAGDNSHAEGNSTIASGFTTHAEGYSTIAVGMYSHAEGYYASAVGEKSHAEGESTIAAGSWSHAEGQRTSAVGPVSHAEGAGTSAIGAGSHAEGTCTIAGDVCMHVGGQFNKTSANAAFVIGNGSSVYDQESEAVVTTLSDAFIVDWNGAASATKLATSGIADIETAITNIATINTNGVFIGDRKILPGTKLFVEGMPVNNVDYSLVKEYNAFIYNNISAVAVDGTITLGLWNYDTKTYVEEETISTDSQNPTVITVGSTDASDTMEIHLKGTGTIDGITGGIV